MRAPALYRLGSEGARTQWRFQAEIGRVRAKLLHPFAKNVLVDVDVPRRLSHAYVSLTHQADRLDLDETGSRPTNGIGA